MGTYSSYQGRLGKIFDKVYLWNNQTDRDSVTTGRFDLETDLLICLDELYNELTGEGFWKGPITADITAGQDEYDWSVLLPGIQKLIRVTLSDAAQNPREITDWELYEAARKYYGTTTSILGLFTVGLVTRTVGFPSATVANGFRVVREYMPRVPGLVTLSASAVVNNGDGTVKFPAPSNKLLVGAEIDLTGTTNYNGNERIVAVTTDTFSITATYVAETLGVNAKCYLQPAWAENHDKVAVAYLMMACLMRNESSSRTKNLLKVWAGRYEEFRSEVLSSGMSPRLSIRPAGG
jgi:hypothetical protein